MWMSLRHKVPIDPARFQMNGKALCLMSLQMFAFRVPIGGKLLYKDFQLRLTSAFHRELYETKSQHSLHFTLVLHTQPVIKAKVSSHNHLHFIFDLESEKAEGSNSTLLEYTYFNRIKHRKKKTFVQKNNFRQVGIYYKCRGVSGGWAIAHLVFGKIEGAAGQWRRAALLLAHPVLGSHLRP